MDCDVCLLPFTSQERRPKTLPCAHNTVCLECLTKLHDQRCPLCRQVFSGSAHLLPDNFALMRILPESAAVNIAPEPSAPPLDEPNTNSCVQESDEDGWCTDCGDVAGLACGDHVVVPISVALAQMEELAVEPDSPTKSKPKIQPELTSAHPTTASGSKVKAITSKFESKDFVHGSTEVNKNHKLNESASNRQEENQDGRPKCDACKAIITGQWTNAMGKKWHPNHWTCYHCGKQLGLDKFYERQGHPYCVADYQNLFLKTCEQCKKKITGRCTTAMGKTWCEEHFVCAQCQRPFLGASYWDHGGKAYCATCHAQHFAPRCNGCSKAIVGEPYCTAQNRTWHNTCWDRRG